MLKVVNVIRLYLRDLQSRSFVFVFLFFCYARSAGKEWKTTKTTIKTQKRVLALQASRARAV